jgi:PhoPQ-activated pathogenicity-related protein
MVALRACLLIASIVSIAPDAGGQEPRGPAVLDEYLAAPDDAYQWHVVHTHQGDGYTTFVIDLTSQTWLTEKEVNRTTWEHWLTVVRPDEVLYDTALLFIGGGKNEGEPPQDAGERTRRLALESNSVVAELGMVPNQPLIFHDDGQPRSEDDLIAYAWDQFLKSLDPRWIPRLPMVKSAVRALDTIQAVMASEQGGHVRIGRFVVAGGSKRGWTTWLTGASDSRVTAIIPLVIDVLNVQRSMEHHYAAYGFWAPAIDDYVRHKIVDRSYTPEYARLLTIEDPLSYRARLKLPKYIINSAGDEFFLPDSSQFYFDELLGEKHLRYVPNTKHSLSGSDAVDCILAFYQCILSGRPRPSYEWRFEDDGSIAVECHTEPSAVRLWQANSPRARDFRLDTIGEAYRSTPLEPQSPGVYVAEAPQTEEGWTAYFVELEFAATDGPPLKFTTGVRVTPDTLPHQDKLEALRKAQSPSDSQ